MTSALALPSFKNTAIGMAGLLFALSCFFAAAPTAHANSQVPSCAISDSSVCVYSSGLNETQVSALLNLLVSFNVNQATLNHVANILRGQHPSANPIAVSTPSAGQSFSVGDTINMRWADNGPSINSPRYHIVLWPSTYPQGSGWPLAGSGYGLDDVTADNFAWTVDSRPSPGSYLVRVCRLGEDVCGMSGVFTIGSNTAPAFSATPTSGTAPLSVNFSYPSVSDQYRVQFGDNTSVIMTRSIHAPCTQSGCGQDVSVAAHTYAAAGTYHVSMASTACEGSSMPCTTPELGTATITVNGTGCSGACTTFTATPTSGTAPLAVSFAIYRDQNPTDVMDFGDGTSAPLGYQIVDCVQGVSTCPSQILFHTYAQAGTYTARLLQTTCNNSTLTNGSQCPPPTVLGSATVTVTRGACTYASDCPPTQTFSASPTSGQAPLSVMFSSSVPQGYSSTRPYSVDFGDGGSATMGLSGFEQLSLQAAHVYASAGTYRATLRPYFACPSNAVCQIPLPIGQVTITVTGGTTNVTFSASPASGAAPLAVTFKSSTPAVTVDFGDGSVNSYWNLVDGTVNGGYSTKHIYNSAGTYIARAIGPCEGLDCDLLPNSKHPVLGSQTITVTGGTNDATFSASPTSGTVPLSVSFSAGNISGSIQNYAVSFGDGASGNAWDGGSTQQSSTFFQSHTYASAGTYTAKLIVGCIGGASCPNGVIGTATVTVTGPVVYNRSNLPKSQDQLIDHVYGCILGRAADADGRAGWKSMLQKGGSVGDLYNGVFFSPEYLSKNTNNTDYVGAMYRCVLFREPDANGVAGWTAALANQSQTRKGVLQGFVNSSEFQSLLPQLPQALSSYVPGHSASSDVVVAPTCPSSQNGAVSRHTANGACSTSVTSSAQNPLVAAVAQTPAPDITGLMAAAVMAPWQAAVDSLSQILFAIGAY